MGPLRRLLPALTVSGALLPSLAAAQDPALARNGYDGDIALITPTFSKTGMPGIDTPDNERGGSVRWGLSSAYLNNPLTIYEFDQELGAVISHRVENYLGVSVDVSRAFTLRAVMPMVLQWGAEVPRYAAEGFAFGDLDLGMHWAFLRRPGVSMGLRTDVWMPTSRREFYAGESMPRMHLSYLLMGRVGRVRLMTDAGLMARFEPVVTTEDLVLGSEIVWNSGVDVTVVPNAVDVGLGVYTRFGLANLGGAGETAIELLARAKWQVSDLVGVEIGAGRGLTNGYGSTDARAYLGLTFQKVRPPLPSELDVADIDGAGPRPGGPDGLQFNVREINGTPGEIIEKEPEWGEGELARVVSEQIIIRDALRFRLGSHQLQPESLPTLDYIARLLNENGRIAHMVIEGHSSEDGEFRANYKLSIARATAIWERLLDQGVHPSRISLRGMGEVQPAQATERYDELQASRRVVFHITRQYEDWEQPPNYKLDLVRPWDGRAYTAVQPDIPIDEAPLPEEFRAKPPSKDDSLQDVSFEEVDDEEQLDDWEPLEESEAPPDASGDDTTPDETEAE